MEFARMKQVKRNKEWAEREKRRESQMIRE